MTIQCTIFALVAVIFALNGLLGWFVQYEGHAAQGHAILDLLLAVLFFLLAWPDSEVKKHLPRTNELRPSPWDQPTQTRSKQPTRYTR